MGIGLMLTPSEFPQIFNGIHIPLKVSLLSGLGLLEYLYFCEDLDMQPIMAVWAGK